MKELAIRSLDSTGAGFDDELEVGMVLTSESYIGSRDGGEGVKLEDQYLVTEAGPELLTDFPVSLTL